MTRRINLALQGGGAHGAFTWGVLDKLLEDEDIEIAAISGTSAGALNGAALKAGMQNGGRAGAKDSLDRLWTQVGRLDQARLTTGCFRACRWSRHWLMPWQSCRLFHRRDLCRNWCRPMHGDRDGKTRWKMWCADWILPMFVRQARRSCSSGPPMFVLEKYGYFQATKSARRC